MESIKFRKSIEFDFDYKQEIIYYVSKNNVMGDSIGYAFVTLTFDNKIVLRNGKTLFLNPKMRINSFAVNHDKRCQGFGSQILHGLIHDAIESGVITIELDDMSDNYRKKRNIYTKFGFSYTNDIGPEMMLIL